MYPWYNVLWYILACMNVAGESLEKQDVDLVRDIANMYNYDCVALVINRSKKKDIAKFVKDILKKTVIIDTSAEELLFYQKCLVFAVDDDEDDDEHIDKLLKDNSSLIAQSNVFIKTTNIKRVVGWMEKALRFDSNFNLVVKVGEDKLEIKEVYSTNSEDSEPIHLSTYGHWHEGRLIIGHPNMWDRRTDLFGAILK